MSSSFVPRLFSGIQPTGIPHLGNYLGALANWRTLQDDPRFAGNALFCIVDYHALTIPRPAEKLRRDIREMAAALLAIGIDPERSILFAQSSVPAHTELGWLLGCQTPLGWLNRMTQFKEKAGKQKDGASLGLYGYPVLQAADILLYKATHVPVGEDQKQHLELSRDIAGALNRSVGEDVLPSPEPLILPEGARIMSLRDGAKKMSKSDPSAFSRIDLSDDDDTIVQKIRKAKSDSFETIGENASERPEAANLIGILAVLENRTAEAMRREIGALNFSATKQRLIDALIAHLSPIRQRLQTYLADPSALDALLRRGGEQAAALAAPTISEVRHRLGLPDAFS